MSKSLEKIKEHIVHLKKINPSYDEILNFYEKVLQEQEAIKPTITDTPIEIKNDLRTLQIKEGFQLLNKEDFIIDISSSVKLFESICQIWKNATNKMKKNIHKIEKAVRDGKLNIEKLLKKHSDSAYQTEIIKKLKLIVS